MTSTRTRNQPTHHHFPSVFFSGSLSPRTNDPPFLTMADAEKTPVAQPCYDDMTEGRAAEKAAMAVQNKINLHAVPVRAYVDQTVVPIMLQGLAEVARVRPEDPVEFLAAFLLKNNPQQSKASE